MYGNTEIRKPIKYHGDVKKRSRSCMEIFSNTYKDFAQNTSIHGLKYTVRTESGLYEKSFWILIVLCGLGCACYMTYLFWIRYTDNPTRTTILTTFAPTTSIPFPCVTICNLNRLMNNKIDFLVSKLDATDEEKLIAKSAFSQLLAFTHPTQVEFNETELNKLYEILNRNEYYDTVNIMKRISQGCEELLVKCLWNNKEMNCLQLFNETFAVDGICCSFNYAFRQDLVKAKYTAFSGINSGLRVLLNPMLQDKKFSTYYSTGIKVIVHNADDYPSSGSIANIIGVGEETYIQVMGTKLIFSDDVAALSIRERNCLYPHEGYLKLFETEYADSNCVTECLMKAYFKKCNCLPYQFGIFDKPVCNVTMIPCLKAAKRGNLFGTKSRIQFVLDFYLVLAAKEDKTIGISCHCMAQCEDEFYTVMSASSRIVVNESLEEAKSFLLANATKNSTILNIFFLKDQQTILYRDTITSTIYLLSSFGGVYSLFLGCSLITIVEVVYYLFVRFVINMKLIGSVAVNNTDVEETNSKKPKDGNENLDFMYKNIFIN